MISGLARNSACIASIAFVVSGGDHLRENNRQRRVRLNEKEIHVLLKVGWALDREMKVHSREIC